VAKQASAPTITPAPADRLVTLREARDRLTISRTTLYRLAQSGALPIVQITPTRAAVRERDLDAFIAERTTRGSRG
jgi:excisionase family DNA binding protein